MFEVVAEGGGTPEKARLIQALINAGQACLDWVRNWGDCRLCEYDAGLREHEDDCPLKDFPEAHPLPETQPEKTS